MHAIVGGHALLCRPSHIGSLTALPRLASRTLPPSQAGQGCSLLIHEATFEPCLESQARAKRHSTTAEALEVAQVGNCGSGVGISTSGCVGVLAAGCGCLSPRRSLVCPGLTHAPSCTPGRLPALPRCRSAWALTAASSHTSASATPSGQRGCPWLRTTLQLPFLLPTMSPTVTIE